MTALQQTALLLVLILASATDLKWGKVFNALTFPAMAIGIIAQLTIAGSTGLTQSLLGIGAAFVFFFPLYLIHVFAAGDVKLLMAVGAWANVEWVLRIGVYSILVGAVVGLILLVAKLGVTKGVSSVRQHLRGRSGSGSRMPFAPALLCAYFLLEGAERMQWHLF